MQTADFFRARIDEMINLSDPLAVLAQRLPWAQLDLTIKNAQPPAARPAAAPL